MATLLGVLATKKAAFAYMPEELAETKAPLAYNAAELATLLGVLAVKNAPFAYDDAELATPNELLAYELADATVFATAKALLA